MAIEPGAGLPRLLAVALGLVALGCNSPSYGKPQDCTAAGGQCLAGDGITLCAKEGPQNTCDCNPTCGPGGLFCCVAFKDAGEADARSDDTGAGD